MERKGEEGEEGCCVMAVGGMDPVTHRTYPSACSLFFNILGILGLARRVF